MPDRLTCEQAFRRLNDYVDRELNAENVRLVEEHLETCVTCAREYRFEASVLSDVRSKLRRIAIPEDFRDRIARRLAEEDMDA